MNTTVLFVLLASFTFSKVVGSSVAPEKLSPGKNVTKSINNNFAMKLHDTLSQANKDNLLICPFSLEVILIMLYLGSKGKVANEIKSAVELPNSEDDIKKEVKEIIENLGKTTELEIATQMFIKVTFEVKDSYMSTVKQFLHSGIEKVDFSNEPRAVEIINDFVKEKTHNKIPHFLGSVSPGNLLILVNAVHFKAAWLHPFDKSNTAPAPFHIGKDSTINVQMMQHVCRFNYKNDNKLGAQVLELPYEGDRYSMIIILPNDNEDVFDVEKKLIKSDLNNFSNGLIKQKVNVMIPKFKIEIEINLNEILKKLGMTSIFYGPGLENIAEGSLKVSQVLQKAYINVDETGTEAAAATEVIMLGASPGPQAFEPTTPFIADRPFLYGILHRPTETVIFTGRLMKPEDK